MSISLTVNGVTYPYPQPSDLNWGTGATNWAQAVTNSALFLSAGSFPITAQLDFGSNFGLKALNLITETANPASVGFLRLANADAINWRNNANSADLPLGVNSSDQLTYNGNPITGSTALTASRAVVTGASGLLAVSATTSTEIGYVAGVTSAIQTQLNTKTTSGAITNSDLSGSAGITNANLATMATLTIKGNNTGLSATPLNLTVAQTTAMLNAMVGDSGSGGTKGLVPAPASGDAAAGKFLKADGTWAASAGGTVTSVTFTGDGTVLSSTPSSAVTTNGTLTAALATQTARTFLSGPLTGSAATPTFKALTAPTIQKFLSTGTTTGYLFTISTSTTCAVGDTYTNNGNTYTVLGALTAQSGQVLYMSNASAPTGSGTLTRATGSGTASITYSAATTIATYTPASNTLYIRVRAIGSGGGGGGSGTTSGTAATAGTATLFGSNMISAGGGAAGSRGGDGGIGGSSSLGTGPVGIALQGGDGSSGGSATSTSGFMTGGIGGSSAFGGAGFGGGNTSGDADNGHTNTGGGGGGAGSSAVNSSLSGSGGGSGGYVDAIITSVAASYPYRIGTNGTGQTAGTSGFNGGGGGTGLLEITEYYQ